MTDNPNINKIKKISHEQFNALYEISRLLNQAAYEDDLIENALDWVITTINAERGVFVKFMESTDSFEIITARNIEKETITNLSEFSSGVLRKVFERKEALVYHDVQSDPQISQFESIRIQAIKSIIGVPIFREEKVFGVILADSLKNRKEFSEENLLFLNFFSNLVSLALEKILNIEKLKDENRILQNKLESTEKMPDVIGESKPMRILSKLINKVAQSDATVLILGESGTGKELIAKAIHKLSKRKDGPYLAQFCGSIPDSLLESELFGYKKGAFTGANSDKKGLLEVADGGTFFLDEIADITEALQAKLLRVLENREIIRLGDTVVRKVDVKILAATNKDLPQLVREGKFREDLFYRLNVFPVELPPLRDRLSDIPLLVKNYLDQNGKQNFVIEKDTMTKLQSYQWPGNVRQLFNIMQRAIILAENNKITADDIIIDGEEENSLISFGGTLKEIELKVLEERLKQYDDHRGRTAESLGVSVRWIQMKLKEQREN